MYKITVHPFGRVLYGQEGEKLLSLLRRHGLAPDAPCGGSGTCGKCRVVIAGKEVRACGVLIHGDLTVTVPGQAAFHILSPEKQKLSPGQVQEVCAAVDIGTTSVVCCLLDCGTGTKLAVCSAANPQAAFGADVVSRIRAALSGEMIAMTQVIRECVSSLILKCCNGIHLSPDAVKTICIVGNPAMQQLFMGICPDNLVQIPFSPVLTAASAVPAKEYIPILPDAQLLVLPDISGYVGADTIGCIMATGIHQKKNMTLMVDIGTNGEMVLGNAEHMAACATAAGPALEGANIRFGMRACAGAIDHVWLEDGEIRYSTIADAKPAGICGSGLIDAVAVFLKLGKINSRGRIIPGEEMDGERILRLTDSVYLTQEDIRQVQLAKGAIQAGIRLLMEQVGISFHEIDRVLLAGAFGTFLNPENACRIGLLPPELLGKIESVGNAALEGACRMALDFDAFRQTEVLAGQVEYVELGSHPRFSKTFAAAMRF